MILAILALGLCSRLPLSKEALDGGNVSVTRPSPPQPPPQPQPQLQPRQAEPIPVPDVHLDYIEGQTITVSFWKSNDDIPVGVTKMNVQFFRWVYTDPGTCGTVAETMIKEDNIVTPFYFFTSGKRLVIGATYSIQLLLRFGQDTWLGPSNMLVVTTPPKPGPSLVLTPPSPPSLPSPAPPAPLPIIIFPSVSSLASTSRVLELSWCSVQSQESHTVQYRVEKRMLGVPTHSPTSAPSPPPTLAPSTTPTATPTTAAPTTAAPTPILTAVPTTSVPTSPTSPTTAPTAFTAQPTPAPSVFIHRSSTTAAAPTAAWVDLYTGRNHNFSMALPDEAYVYEFRVSEQITCDQSNVGPSCLTSCSTDKLCWSHYSALKVFEDAGSGPTPPPTASPDPTPAPTKRPDQGLADTITIALIAIVAVCALAWFLHCGWAGMMRRRRENSTSTAVAARAVGGPKETAPLLLRAHFLSGSRASSGSSSPVSGSERLRSEGRSKSNNNLPKHQSVLSSKEELRRWRIKFSDLEFLHVVGAGAAGQVWKGRWMGTIVAIKEGYFTLPLTEETIEEVEEERQSPVPLPAEGVIGPHGFIEPAEGTNSTVIEHAHSPANATVPVPTLDDADDDGDEDEATRELRKKRFEQIEEGSRHTNEKLVGSVHIVPLKTGDEEVLGVDERDRSTGVPIVTERYSSTDFESGGSPVRERGGINSPPSSKKKSGLLASLFRSKQQPTSETTALLSASAPSTTIFASSFKKRPPKEPALPPSSSSVLLGSDPKLIPGTEDWLWDLAGRSEVLKEAAILKSLRHPNIVQVMGVCCATHQEMRLVVKERQRRRAASTTGADSVVAEKWARMLSQSPDTNRQFLIFLVLEFCDGGSLYDMMRRVFTSRIIRAPQSFSPTNQASLSDSFEATSDAPPFPDWKWRLHVLRSVVLGLVYLHAQHPPVLHRDLKSLNILLSDNSAATLDPSDPTKHATSPQKSLPAVKITDFGISRLMRDEEHNRTMTKGVGSPVWCAPEVIREEEYTISADVYSLAILMWELMHFHPPFENMKLFEVPYRVANEGLRPPPICCCLHGCLTCGCGTGRRPGKNVEPPLGYIHLMQRCWVNEPQKRPSCKEILTVLDSIIDGGTSNQPSCALPNSCHHTRTKK